MGTELPHYEQPPIDEVVCGVSFEHLPALKVPHIGLFWNEILEELPECQQADPLPSDEPSDPPPQFPRVWLISADSNSLLQLQQNRLLFNWRKNDSPEPYPRFETVYKQFTHFVKRFSFFLNKHGLGELNPTRYTLSYINIIKEGDIWSSPAEIGRVLRDVNWIQEEDRFLPPPEVVNWFSSFKLPDEMGDLNVKMQQALKQDTKEKAFRLELSANSKKIEEQNPEREEWFDLAHEWIVKGFEDLTPLDVQQQTWGKYE